MTRIFVADTETSGLGKDAQVCEYAHVECRLNNNSLIEVTRYETLLKPTILIPKEATAVHGITDAMVATAPTLREVLPASLRLARGEFATVIGHNFTGYDMQYLDGVFPKQLEIGCSLKAARKFIDAPKRSLDFLRVHLNLESMGQAHSALADCLDTMQVVNHMLKERTWDELAEVMLAKPTEISFGKHKGMKLEDLSSSYVRWLLEDCDSTSWELRKALEEL